MENKNFVLAESQKNSDVNTLFQCYDELNNLFGVLFKIAKRYNYADLTALQDSTLEMSAQISLIANEIFNPESVELVDAVREKDIAFSTKVHSVS